MRGGDVFRWRIFRSRPPRLQAAAKGTNLIRRCPWYRPPPPTPQNHRAAARSPVVTSQKGALVDPQQPPSLPLSFPLSSRRSCEASRTHADVDFFPVHPLRLWDASVVVTSSRVCVQKSAHHHRIPRGGAAPMPFYGCSRFSVSWSAVVTKARAHARSGALPEGRVGEGDARSPASLLLLPPWCPPRLP